MAEELQAGVCGENWWNINNSSRNIVFPLCSSPCSMVANYMDAVNFSTWQTDNLVDLKHPTRSCEALVCDNSLGFLDEQKTTKQSDSSAVSMGSTWTHHSHSLFGRASESKFHSVVEEEAGIDASNDSQVSTINDAFKPMNNQQFSLKHQSSDSYGYGNSKMMQSLYNHDPQPRPQPQAEHSLFTNRSMAYGYNSSNELVSPTWSKVSPFLKPSMPNQHLSGFHFSNNTTPSSSPFWNASALDDVPVDVFASSPNSQYPSQTFEQKPKNKREEAPDSAQVMNKRSTVCESAFKRPRIETPSPLPTFKVRKEKLGDRITALQQLVSPFGKTDTASVLHEAIEYIKYLHDQVSVLSTPYKNHNGASIHHQQGCDKKESEREKADLRRQGLCLVPISCTFPVANYEITAELWTPPLTR